MTTSATTLEPALTSAVQEFARQLADRYAVQRVILLGSRARGRSGSHTSSLSAEHRERRGEEQVRRPQLLYRTPSNFDAACKVISASLSHASPAVEFEKIPQETSS